MVCWTNQSEAKASADNLCNYLELHESCLMLYWGYPEVTGCLGAAFDTDKSVSKWPSTLIFLLYVGT